MKFRYFFRNSEIQTTADNQENGILDSPKTETTDKVIDSLDNNKEESESLVAECEPYYDSVPAEDSDGECKYFAKTKF